MRLVALFRWETVVFLAWVAMTVLAGVFVARYGQNLPRQDEWEFVPVLYGVDSRWDWIFARHNEHRYILARVAYLLLDTLSNHDFRVGMWVTVALLSASSLLLIHLARELRGRSHPIDVFFPVLLLNAGHCENLLMGYQIAFTLTAFFLVVLLRVMVRVEQLGPFGAGLRAGILLLAIMLGGGVGLVFVPGISLWIVVQAFRTGRSWRSVGLLVCPLLALSFAAYCGYETLRNPPISPRNDATATMWHALEFLTQGLGGVGRFGWPVLGVILLAVQVDVAVSLVRVILFRPSDRYRALGWLVVLGSVWLLALVIGHTREATTDFRYTTLSCLAVCVCLLTAARYVRWRPRLGPGALVLLASAAAVAYCDWLYGKQFADVYVVRYHALKIDIKSGVPVDLIAERHPIFPVPEFRGSFRLLHERGFPTLRDAAPPQRLKAIEVPLPPNAKVPGWAVGEGPIPRLTFTLPQPRRVKAIRVYFTSEDSRYFEYYQLHWTSPGNADPRMSSVLPWIVPGDATTAFWIDDTVSGFWLQVGHPSKGLTLKRVELLVSDE